MDIQQYKKLHGTKTTRLAVEKCLGFIIPGTLSPMEQALVDSVKRCMVQLEQALEQVQ